ncbi:hypothetical protein L596_020021 [Steinernema carpocapsae]|uniref:7TM GPCR serpentine receptor class x (Srx) domain-containing protein n=1 Tax=Steinernema carpocapsae TaxID=34508 RepID=A0A4U5MSD3_STECR|nr:hypothetical protein L596_020021 [Steinernema carpocapsae]
MCSPWVGFIAVPGIFLLVPDLSLSHTIQFHYISGYIYETVLLFTFITYITLFLHILYVKLKSSITKTIGKEAKILVYAGIRFTCDMVLNIIFHYVYVPTNPVASFALGCCYGVNNIILPPLLYLCIASSIRKDFFEFECKQKHKSAESASVCLKQNNHRCVQPAREELF